MYKNRKIRQAPPRRKRRKSGPFGCNDAKGHLCPQVEEEARRRRRKVFPRESLEIERTVVPLQRGGLIRQLKKRGDLRRRGKLRLAWKGKNEGSGRKERNHIKKRAWFGKSRRAKKKREHPPRQLDNRGGDESEREKKKRCAFSYKVRRETVSLTIGSKREGGSRRSEASNSLKR